MRVQKKNGQHFNTEQKRDKFGRFIKVETKPKAGKVTRSPELDEIVLNNSQIDLKEMFGDYKLDIEELSGK